MNPRDEDDRSPLEPRMLPDEARGLETVHFRHADIENNDREVLSEQPLQCLPPRKSAHTGHTHPLENGLVSQKPRRLVVDQQNAGLGRLVGHRVG